MNDFDYIKRNYVSLKEEIGTLSAKLGVKEPTLVCVTKSGGDDELLALCRAGAADIGENRPGEVLRRGTILKEAGLDARMHEIGTLQRNKVKLIAESVHMIHSIDSLKLARDVDRFAEGFNRKIPVLVEINSAKEEQKSGILPEEAEEFISALKDFKSIELRGLMTMGPVSFDPEELRPYFKATRTLFDRLSDNFGKEPILSMGMSDSYRIAIEEGSTLVRVGRKLFIK